MKNLIKISAALMLVFAISSFGSTKSVQEEADSIVGLWEPSNGKARVKISKIGNKYFGKIVWLKEPVDPKANLVPIEDIKEGEWFTKRTGHNAYIKTSKSAMKYLLGYYSNKSYGVCYNGNLTHIKPKTLVKPVSFQQYLKNVHEEDQWHRDVGAKKD